MITMPLLIPLAALIISLFFYKKVKAHKLIGLFGSISLLVVAVFILTTVRSKGIMVMQAGGWAAPFGITLVIDLFSAIMLVVTAVVGVCVAFYSFTGIKEDRHRYQYFIFFHGIMLGANGALITGDVFNFYVWLEVLLMSSFGMLLIGGHKLQLEGGIKYITMNVIASVIFLAGVGVLYGQTGTLNMADLSMLIRGGSSLPYLNMAAILFFVSLGIKAALFPFFYWLPASYHTPPIAVTAMFAGILTKVGVYALIRFYTLFFHQDIQMWNIIFLVVAGFTMLVGVLTAASQIELRKIFSFHIISQIGYMIMGLGIYTPLALGGTIYFMAHNIFAKTNALLVSGLVQKKYGTFSLGKLGNLYREAPFIAFLFLIPALALAGVPPLSGFFGKFLLVKAGFDTEHYIIAGVSLLVSLLTLFSMLKIWDAVFLKHKTEYEMKVKTGNSFGFFEIFPVVLLALMSIILGIAAGYFIELSMEAGEQLMDNSYYINSVLKLRVQ